MLCGVRSHVILGLALAAQGDPAAIQQKLSAQFKLTRITADRSDIVTPGDIVVIHKPGLMMYAVTSPLPAVEYLQERQRSGKAGADSARISQSACRRRAEEPQPIIRIARLCPMKNGG